MYIEVGRRIGFPVKGVGMPFHFIGKHQAESGDIFIDPFNEGRLLGEAGCAELVAEMSSGKSELQSVHLEPVTNKQILARITLSSILLGRHNGNQLLPAVRRYLHNSPGVE